MRKSDTGMRIAQHMEPEVVARIVAEDRADPKTALLYALEEIQRTTEALIAAYKAKLALDPPSGGMLSRGQRRTQSALRAAGKAYAKATASIRNLNRQMTREK
jgi:hypothetical protein